MLKNKLERYIVLSIALAMLQFILIMCIPFVNIKGTGVQCVMAYIVALLFWLSIIAEVILAIYSTRIRKKVGCELNGHDAVEGFGPGIILFFKNKEAVVADIVLFVSVLLLGIILWMNMKIGWLIIGNVSFLVLSFNLHCILNGRNYRLLKSFKNDLKERKSDE